MKQSGPRCTSRGRHPIVRFQLPAYVVTASYEVTVVTVDGTVTRDIFENVDEMQEVEVELDEDESVAKLEKPIYM